MLLRFNRHIPEPILTGCWSLPCVRRHSVKNRARDSESRRHRLSVTFVKGIDVLAYCRHRICSCHFISPFWNALSGDLTFRQRAQAGRFLLESSILPLMGDLFSVAIFVQKCSRLSSRPNNVLKMVESASNTSPARSPFGGIQRNMLNSLLPASTNGCGLDVSIGCLASTCIDFVSSVVSA